MRRRRPTRNVPIVTLLTDFGLRDSYVAEIKGVLLRKCPGVRIVDVTHEVPPQDVLAASILLERVLRVFPPGTVHIAVVDPGVGTDRRLLLAEIDGQTVLCPDNGLITWAHRRLGGNAHNLNWKTQRASPTFHGRDILAPAAAELARGQGRRLKAKPIDPVLLDVRPAPAGAREGAVIYIDHFGNAVTNFPGELGPKRVTVARKSIPIRRTYADVPVGQSLALVGSSGLLELAVRDGSAAQKLRLAVGTVVRLEW
jgi:S-adenosyl-L-methionine hydrolase (adenosine-forming)